MTGHTYGPHDPSTAPKFVTVGVKGGVVGATFTALRKERVIEPCGDETSSDAGTHGHRIYLWRAAA